MDRAQDKGGPAVGGVAQDVEADGLAFDAVAQVDHLFNRLGWERGRGRDARGGRGLGNRLGRLIGRAAGERKGQQENRRPCRAGGLSTVHWFGSITVRRNRGNLPRRGASNESPHGRVARATKWRAFMRRMMASAVLAAAVAGFWHDPALAQAQNAAQNQKRADQTNVPVKVVVLFSSGVGYFEHAGAVTGNASSELRFKTQQINDILKSLVLQDMGGGRVTTVVYPSQDPIEKTLRSFQVDITGDPSLAELLSQLRGAKVQLTLGGEQVGGTILGLEKKPKDRPEIGR